MTDQALRPKVLTKAALERLRDELEAAESPADFLAAADALISDPNNLFSRADEGGSLLPLSLESVGPEHDLEVALSVYDHLGVMDRANAADPRLWSYLAFTTFRNYMERRWPLTVDDWRARVRARWLLTSASRGTLDRHGVSSLWWLVNATHDPERSRTLSAATDDEFAYTRVLFRNQDWIQSAFDREIGAFTEVVLAAVDQFLESRPKNRGKFIQALMKELGLVGAYQDLGVLGADELRNVVREAVGRFEFEEDPAWEIWVGAGEAPRDGHGAGATGGVMS